MDQLRSVAASCCNLGCHVQLLWLSMAPGCIRHSNNQDLSNPALKEPRSNPSQDPAKHSIIRGPRKHTLTYAHKQMHTFEIRISRPHLLPPQPPHSPSTPPVGGRRSCPHPAPCCQGNHPQSHTAGCGQPRCYRAGEASSTSCRRWSGHDPCSSGSSSRSGSILPHRGRGQQK